MTDKQKGIVLEVTSKGSLTVLTPQGEFLNIPSLQAVPEVGSEIEFMPPSANQLRKIFNTNTYWLAAAAACLLLFFLALPLWNVLISGPAQVVAYVSVDINPSIEMGVNERGNVKEAVGLNEDGIRLLHNLNLSNRRIQEAIELITAEAVKEKYLAANKENNIVITVSGEENIKTSVKGLDQQAKKVLSANKISGEANFLEVSMDLHDKAKDLGVSPGKYVILMEAVDEGLDLSLDDIKGNSIVKAVKAAGGIPGQLISKAQQDKNELNEVEKRTSEKIQDNIKNTSVPNSQEGLKQNNNPDKTVEKQHQEMPANLKTDKLNNEHDEKINSEIDEDNDVQAGNGQAKEDTVKNKDRSSPDGPKEGSPK